MARIEAPIGINQIADDAEGLLAALDCGESLPADWYTDPAIGERQLVQIFRKTWNYVGPHAELRMIGDLHHQLRRRRSRGS